MLQIDGLGGQVCDASDAELLIRVGGTTEGSKSGRLPGVVMDMAVPLRGIMDEIGSRVL